MYSNSYHKGERKSVGKNDAVNFIATRMECVLRESLWFVNVKAYGVCSNLELILCVCVELQVLHEPKEITCDVMYRYGYSRSRRLSRINIPLPGDHIYRSGKVI